MFTHLNINSNVSFTTGEKITGGTSGATATVESLSTVTANAVSNISAANPGIVTSNGHNLKEGQQIRFISPSFAVDSTAVQATDVFTVRNPGVNDFQLFSADGTTGANVTSFTSSGNLTHGVVVCSSVNGTFVAGETITGCLLYTSPSPRDSDTSRMPSSA